MLYYFFTSTPKLLRDKTRQERLYFSDGRDDSALKEAAFLWKQEYDHILWLLRGPCAWQLDAKIIQQELRKKLPCKGTLQGHHKEVCVDFLGSITRTRCLCSSSAFCLWRRLQAALSRCSDSACSPHKAGRKVAWNHIYCHYQVTLSLQCLFRMWASQRGYARRSGEGGNWTYAAT